MMARGKSIETQALGKAVPRIELDQGFLRREATIRFGRELADAIEQVCSVAHWTPDASQARAVASSAERLRSVSLLYGLICGTADQVNIAIRITALCDALAGCTAVRGDFTPMKLKLVETAIDGTTANAVSLTILALLAGDVAGGPLFTDGHVEIDFAATANHLVVRFRDVSDDPPNRIAVGGRLLSRMLDATNARTVAREKPGFASVEIEIPYSGALPLRTAGSA